jgi:hypothetical protein
MKPARQFLTSLLLAGVLIFPVLIGGCAARTYRVYDPYYSDYHVWDSNEIVFYHRWEVETHREHREFRRRGPEQQREYWAWRHNHR